MAAWSSSLQFAVYVVLPVKTCAPQNTPRTLERSEQSHSDKENQRSFSVDPEQTLLGVMQKFRESGKR
ncbi:hypothetical protein U1Q18_021123 [Sarracenia purpurea var. burkii]